MAAWEASLKCGGNCGIRERAVASLRRLHHKGHHRLPHKGHLRPPCKGIVLVHRTVQFANGVTPSNKWPVHQRVYFSYRTNCHICGLFANRHRLAGSGHIHKWHLVAPHFLCQNGEVSLVSSTGNMSTCRTPSLTSNYPGQARSCSFVNVLATSN